MPSSTVWFTGRLLPEALATFQLTSAIRLGSWGGEDEVAILGAVGSRVWVIRRGDPADGGFDRMREQGTRLLRGLLGQYALRRNPSLDVALDAWIESPSATDMHSTLGGIQVHPDSASGREAEGANAELQFAAGEIELALGTPSADDWLAAFSDVGLALRETTDDAFFYARRAVDHALRALLRHRGKIEWEQWESLASSLGQPSEQLRAWRLPLDETRNALAHGDLYANALELARADRGGLIEIGVEVVRNCWAREAHAAFFGEAAMPTANEP